jgi:hypothetical protein
MISNLLFHPISLTIFLIFSILWLKDLIRGGTTVHAIRRTVQDHIKQMTKQDTDLAWDGLSYELKVKLTDPKRLKKKGRLYVGSKRVADFAAFHSKVYKNGELVIEIIQRIRRVKAPRRMYVVRLRSKITGTVRLTVWVSFVPGRAISWGVEDVCIHPASGDLAKGETLTGARVGDPNATANNSDKKPAKAKKSKNNRRLKEEAA